LAHSFLLRCTPPLLNSSPPAHCTLRDGRATPAWLPTWRRPATTGTSQLNDPSCAHGQLYNSMMGKRSKRWASDQNEVGSDLGAAWRGRVRRKKRPWRGLAIIKLAQRGMPSPLICDTHDSTLSSVMSFSLSSSNGSPRNLSPRTLLDDWCWYGPAST